MSDPASIYVAGSLGLWAERSKNVRDMKNVIDLRLSKHLLGDARDQQNKVRSVKT